jgi:hypothetical protein
MENRQKINNRKRFKHYGAISYKEMVKITGYISFLVSCLLWGMVFITPFLELSKKQIAAITAILIIAGEITFYLSIILLGRSIIENITNKLKFWKKKISDSTSSKQSDQK